MQHGLAASVATVWGRAGGSGSSLDNPQRLGLHRTAILAFSLVFPAVIPERSRFGRILSKYLTFICRSVCTFVYVVMRRQIKSAARAILRQHTRCECYINFRVLYQLPTVLYQLPNSGKRSRTAVVSVKNSSGARKRSMKRGRRA